MDPRFVTVLKRELAWNCWVAQGAWFRLREMKRAKQIPGTVPGVSRGRVNLDPLLRWSTESWSQVHALLGATAGISRTLWPAKNASQKTKQRAADLLKELDLPPLPELKSRAVRNAYEHFENSGPEWLEWALTAFPGRPLMGWQMGDGGPFGEKNVLPEECFRYLDQVHWTLRVGREPPLDLKQLMVAVELLGRSISVNHHFDVGLPK
jgi:hypothetical protein